MHVHMYKLYTAREARTRHVEFVYIGHFQINLILHNDFHLGRVTSQQFHPFNHTQFDYDYLSPLTFDGVMGKSSKDKQDVFYRLAKEEGWRARSAFKLLQINEQFGLFDGVSRAVDLCAAPGSWSQVLTRKLRMKKEPNTTATTRDTTLSSNVDSYQTNDAKDDVKIVAVDIQTMAPIDGVTIIQGDITRFETSDKIINEFKGSKAQLVVCDGAPDVTGQHDLDEFMQSQLLLAALNITTFIIEEGGTFVAKIFRGKDISVMVVQFRLFFEQVRVIKPKSSRASSIEAFICCRNFKLPPNYKPRMFHLLTNFSARDLQNDQMDRDARMIIPFLMCGDLNELTN